MVKCVHKSGLDTEILAISKKNTKATFYEDSKYDRAVSNIACIISDHRTALIRRNGCLYKLRLELHRDFYTQKSSGGKNQQERVDGQKSVK